jgi:hypothetical protein
MCGGSREETEPPRNTHAGQNVGRETCVAPAHETKQQPPTVLNPDWAASLENRARGGEYRTSEEQGDELGMVARPRRSISGGIDMGIVDLGGVNLGAITGADG